MSNTAEPAARGFAAFCRADGQFSLLLDAAFDVVWHTTTLTEILGYDSIVGRNALEFIDPQDIQIVVDLIARMADRIDNDELNAPAFRADPSDVRLIAASGESITLEALMYDYTHDPVINGLLVTCKVVVDRSDIARSIELLGTGAAVADVLSLIARLADRGFGGEGLCVVGWWHEDEVRVAWSPERDLPDVAIAEAARNATRLGIREGITILDLDDPVLAGAGTIARDLGFSAAHLMPIVAPDSGDVLGCLVGWGHHTVEMTLYPQRPIHVGLRIAALAIMDGRTKTDLRWAASHDSLTLLINRAEFARRLDMMDETVALLYIDLDDFKPINDVHGHSVGDAVLVEVASRIRETVGIAGVAGRLGGDEFAVAMPDASLHDGLLMADRVVAALRRPIRVCDVSLGIGASVGVAQGVQPLIPSMLIQRADEALLDAKNSGKNTVRVAAHA